MHQFTCSRSNVMVKSAMAKSARCSSSSRIMPSHSLLFANYMQIEIHKIIVIITHKFPCPERDERQITANGHSGLLHGGASGIISDGSILYCNLIEFRY